MNWAFTFYFVRFHFVEPRVINQIINVPQILNFIVKKIFIKSEEWGDCS